MGMICEFLVAAAAYGLRQTLSERMSMRPILAAWKQQTLTAVVPSYP